MIKKGQLAELVAPLDILRGSMLSTTAKLIEQSGIRKAINVICNTQVAVWILLNLFDLSLSIIALEYGKANESLMLRFFLEKVGSTAYYYWSSYIWFGLWKMGLAVCVPFFLAWIKKPHLLKWLNICMIGLCLYITVMLIKTFS